ncbi:hypothetical protein [Peribacillus loiseleuriae]|uniref:hypothetical protein n=1 Tax=Peribacillus loiseleuriae TaxID=1679170 RepID=UPI003D00693B
MKSALAAFMGLALTATVIVALLFMVGYKVVDDEITGPDGYSDTVTKVASPETSASQARK